MNWSRVKPLRPAPDACRGGVQLDAKRPWLLPAQRRDGGQFVIQQLFEQLNTAMSASAGLWLILPAP